MQNLDYRTTLVVLTLFVTLFAMFAVTFYFYRFRIKRQANAILQNYYDSAILSFDEYANGKQVSAAMFQALSEAAKLRTTNTDSLEIMNEMQKTYNIFIPDQVIEKVFFSYNLNMLVAEYDKYLKSHVPISQIETMLKEAYVLKYSQPLNLFIRHLVRSHNRFDLQRYFPKVIEKIKSEIPLTEVIDYITDELNIEMTETELYNSLNQMMYEEALREGEIISEKYSRGEISSITEELTRLNHKYLSYGFNVQITRADVDEIYNIEVERKTRAIEDFENLIQELEQELAEQKFMISEKLNRYEQTFDVYRTKTYEQKEIYDEKIKRLENEMSKVTVELMEYKEAEKLRIEKELNRVIEELREKINEQV
ncbi:MAG: hypothetical protein ACRCV7_04175 [Culicoidibacterales bacterium]